MPRDRRYLYAKFSGMSYVGGRVMKLGSNITEGPEQSKGRYCYVHMKFEEVESLYKFMLECKVRAEADEKRTEEINRRNSEV